MFTNINSKKLLLAARENNYNKVKAVLKKENVNTNLQDESGKTALHWAVIHTDPFMSLIIINNYAIDGKVRNNIIKPNINIQDNYGCTALHYLAININNLKFSNNKNG